MLLRRLDGPDPRVRAQGDLGIRNVLVQVGMVEPPVLKGRYHLRDCLLANIRVGYGALAPRLLLFHTPCSAEGGTRGEGRAYLLTRGLVAQEHAHLCCRDGEGRDHGPARDRLHLLLLKALPPRLVPVDVPLVGARSRLVALLLLCVGQAGCLRLGLESCKGGLHPRRQVGAGGGQQLGACQSRRGRAREQGQGHLEPGRWLWQEGSLSLIKRGHAQAVLERRVDVTQAAGPAVVTATPGWQGSASWWSRAGGGGRGGRRMRRRR